MSWDVFLFRDETTPLGPAADVRAAISAVHPATDWSDPTWGTLDGDGWSIEFNAGDKDPIDSIMLHVRGGGDPVPAILALCQATGWTALDTSTDEPLDPAGSSWSEFQAYRDQVVGAIHGRMLPRAGLQLDGTTLVHGEQRHDLADAEDLRFEPRYNWASVILAILFFTATVALKKLIPFAMLGWIIAGALAGLGVLFLFAIRTETLVFRAGDRRVVYPLIGRPEEIAAFRENVIAAAGK